MLDNGYALMRFEILNWGNFHGYQRFNLRSSEVEGPLFAPPSACAILGVNGSGKSTLIDAMMIALLPFEGSVKLGVTNDVETGSAGGRTVRDYVLGKHSSTTGRDGGTLAGSMGRRDGCSMVLLTFRHNRNKDRCITIGRCWWYSNFVVSDTQIAFLSYNDVSIAQFCPNGKTPRAPKIFRQHCKDLLPQVQIFDTMQTYFAALSGSFGKISRDDLRIFNRAFYVKSISQIDLFIRENMLLEHPNPHLERLLENVRNGKEIAFAIDTCERKLSAIGRILKDLRKLEENVELKSSLERQELLLRLYKDWDDLRRMKEEAEKLRHRVRSHEELLPASRRAVEDARRQQLGIQSLIVHNDIDSRLQKLAVEIDYLSAQLKRLQERHALILRRAESLAVVLPRRAQDWPQFGAKIDGMLKEVGEAILERQAELSQQREMKYRIDSDAKSIREELQHLSQFKTLIPRDLHSIKLEAIEQLKIPASHLFFVGELMQVPKEQAEFRRAIESVLAPISRNLLCHPDQLELLTKWLNAKGLRSDLVAKRITPGDLNSEEGAWAGSYRSKLKSGEGSGFVLDKIEVLHESQHPFTSYLWNWLRAKFDFKIVDLKSFKADEEQLVTVEGLVKSDRRTMRKQKQNFSFSLGWDNGERVEELSSNLHSLNAKHEELIKVLSMAEKALLLDEDRRRFFEELQGECGDFIETEPSRRRLEGIVAEKEALLKGNPDYRKLKEQEVEVSRLLQELLKRESQLEAEVASDLKRISNLDLVLPRQEDELNESPLFSRLRLNFGGQSALIEALANVETDLARRKLSRHQFEAQLSNEIAVTEKLSDKLRSSASSNLNGYRRDFNDPGLSYEVPPSSSLGPFVSEWSRAEERLQKTDLPQAQEKWRRFFDQVLMESVKDTINEIKSRIYDTERSIQSINEVLKLTNFEDLPQDQRYLQIDLQSSNDDRIRRFRRSIAELEKILGPTVRAQVESQSQSIMNVLIPFVEEFQNEPAYRAYVTDVRNHFQFEVHSLRRRMDQEDERVEVFTGARRDAKSSAQTTQLAYTLLASCLAYRFKFHDPIGGQETPRMLVLDEFGGKFDNEKPREILKLLDQMGFQPILVSPMSKADLLAESVSQLVFVHKASATHSKVHSFEIASKQDYDHLIQKMSGGSRDNSTDASP
jgi:uncharacterized protein YPO0396